MSMWPRLGLQQIGIQWIALSVLLVSCMLWSRVGIWGAPPPSTGSVTPSGTILFSLHTNGTLIPGCGCLLFAVTAWVENDVLSGLRRRPNGGTACPPSLRRSQKRNGRCTMAVFPSFRAAQHDRVALQLENTWRHLLLDDSCLLSR